MDHDGLIHVFGFLNKWDLMNASLVNTIFNKASDYFGLWKKMCEQQFPIINTQYHFKETYIKYYTLSRFLWSRGNISIENAIKEPQLYFNHRAIDSIPEEIELLTNLQTLEIMNNHLTEIPNGISKLTNLKALHFNDNNLRGIPYGFDKLMNLTHLGINKNEIHIFPQEICFLVNLTDINISHNELTIIPRDISLLCKLNVLTLDNNLLRDLPEELGLLTNLTRIDLEYNPFEHNLFSLKTLTKLNTLWINLSNEKFIPDEVLYAISRVGY